MTTNQRRRTLLLLACLGPVAQAGTLLNPRSADQPVDLIRRVFDEVLASPRQNGPARMQDV